MIRRTSQKAVSLKYDPTLPAPFVSARSEGELARRMLSLAEESDVPIVRLDGLAEDLFLLNPGELIPEYLFTIVAEILAFIYSVREPE